MSDEDDAPPASRQPNAAEPRDVAKREKRIDREKREDRDFLRKVFADPVGRRFLWQLLHDAGAFTVQFGASPNGTPDPQATVYHGARRDLGLGWFAQWMAADRDGIWAMLDEHDPRFGAKVPKDDG